MENIIVGIIVGTVFLLAGRSFYRKLTGRAGGCACSDGGCPKAGLWNQTHGAKVTHLNVLGCADARGSRDEDKDM